MALEFCIDFSFFPEDTLQRRGCKGQRMNGGVRIARRLAVGVKAASGALSRQSRGNSGALLIRCAAPAICQLASIAAPAPIGLMNLTIGPMSIEEADEEEDVEEPR